MNTSQFMDKQIMDLSSQGSPIKSKDFIDLMKNPIDDDDLSDSHGDGIKKDEIVASYDFQPIRPVGVASQTGNLDAVDGLGESVRTWNSMDSKINSSANVRNYGSLDSLEPSKVTPEKDQNIFDAAIVSEIDRTMKKHADSLLNVLEGVSARLTQLESRTRHLENSVDDLKVSVGNNHGSTDGKMRQLENILREVQTGINDLKEGGRMHLEKLDIAKKFHLSENQNIGHLDSVQHAASAPHQSHQPLPPGTFPQSLPSLPFPNAPPPPPPQQNPPPPVQLPNQFPQGQVPSIPHRDTYFPPPGQAPEVPNQQYQLHLTQLQHPPSAAPPQPPSAAPPHQQYQPVPQPQYPQSPRSSQQHPSLAPVNPPQHQPSLVHHPEEPPYIPSQSYPPNLRQSSSQPSTGPPPSQQQFYGPPPQIYEPQPSRTNSGFSAGYGPPSGLNEQYPYGGSASQYGSSTTMKPQQLSSPAVPHVGGSGYPQLPTARILPQALPTASGVGGGSGSTGTGNRVPADDVVDKVTSMGFPRDHVRATVRKLTENGQSVDLNIVLDKLMNDSDVQPPKGWFGR